MIKRFAIYIQKYLNLSSIIITFCGRSKHHMVFPGQRFLSLNLSPIIITMRWNHSTMLWDNWEGIPPNSPNLDKASPSKLGHLKEGIGENEGLESSLPLERIVEDASFAKQDQRKIPKRGRRAFLQEVIGWNDIVMRFSPNPPCQFAWVQIPQIAFQVTFRGDMFYWEAFPTLKSNVFLINQLAPT